MPNTIQRAIETLNREPLTVEISGRIDGFGERYTVRRLGRRGLVEVETAGETITTRLPGVA
jgi:hypothetical protein